MLVPHSLTASRARASIPTLNVAQAEPSVVKIARPLDREVGASCQMVQRVVKYLAWSTKSAVGLAER
jgi:hypothetical protein